MITTITPCYRSAEYLPQVVQKIKNALVNEDYQIILVCDGSPDNTFEVIRQLCDEDERVVGINLTRNFGQPSARCAAIPHIKGDYVVFLDDDGEHPTEEILNLVKKLQEGYDICYADFTTQTHGVFKRFSSKVNTYMMRLLLGVPKGIRPSSFFAVKKFVAKSLENYKSPTPYTIGYFLQVTRNVCNLKMAHNKRISGKSTYSFKKLVNIWIDGLTSFSIVPLRIASVLGVSTSLIGIVYGIFIVIRRLINPSLAAGFASILAALLFSTGIIMFLLGLLGEYIGRIYMSLNNIPQYAVREVINGEDD